MLIWKMAFLLITCSCTAGSHGLLLVQADSFTSTPIAEALVRAHERGVNVQVLLDNSLRTQKYNLAGIFIHAAIPTLIDASHAIEHPKGYDH